jgi:hypothetical protein
VFDGFAPQLELFLAAVVYSLVGLFLGSLMGELLGAALPATASLAAEGELAWQLNVGLKRCEHPCGAPRDGFSFSAGPRVRIQLSVLSAYPKMLRIQPFLARETKGFCPRFCPRRERQRTRDGVIFAGKPARSEGSRFMRIVAQQRPAGWLTRGQGNCGSYLLGQGERTFTPGVASNGSRRWKRESISSPTRLKGHFCLEMAQCSLLTLDAFCLLGDEEVSPGRTLKRCNTRFLRRR